MAKTIVLTGASDGIGRAAARRLAADGHRLVLVGRSPRKTEAVASELGVPYYVADFAELAQVRDLAERLLTDAPRIDVLANNAGLMVHSPTLSTDGHELTMQVNHLAPFLLTNLLADRLRANDATVVTTSSMAHAFARLDPDHLTQRKGWRPMRAYGTSKLANILFTRQLGTRLGLRAACFHPGVVASSFGESGTGLFRAAYRPPLSKLFTITPEQGADTLVWLAETNAWQPGGYYVKRTLTQPSRTARDDSLASRLWDTSAQAVGA